MARQNSFWSDKRVVVTGGTGFIGGHLCNKLRSLGAQVLVCSLSEPSDLTQDLSTPTGTIIFHTTLVEFTPDVVVHLAAQPIVDFASERLTETVAVNVLAASNVLSACRGVSSIQSILFISTDKVYGNLPVIRHNSIPNGVEHPYNASKLAGDILAQMYANFFELPITIVRHGNIYGAGDRHLERIVPKTFYRVWKDAAPIIRGTGQSLRDYIHVSDIINAYVKIIEVEWGKGGEIYNLGSHVPCSVMDMVDTILKITKRIDLVPTYRDMLQGEIPNQHIVDTVSKEKIGWEPLVDLETGLELTAPYYKDITWIPR